MDRNTNINHVPAHGQVDPSMLRLPVTALGSSLFPRIASSSSPHFIRHLVSPAAPPFYPWYTATTLPFPMSPVRFLYSGRGFGPNFRQICSTNGLRMERREREREPPFKRRKSSEERPKLENTKEKTHNYKKDSGLLDKSQAGRYFSREKDVDRTKKVQQANMEEEVAGSNPRMTSIDDNQAQSNVHVKPLHRLWELAPPCRSDTTPPPGVSVGFDFTVMSYNILSQDLLEDNAYLYRHCHPKVLSWEYRLPNLLQEIQHHNADILCLQEVQEDHFVMQLRPALVALGYKCVYKKRTGYKSDGCAVVYRKSRLSLLSFNPVEFYRRGDTLLDRDNVGLVVQLSPISDPASSFCVANTHLLYNPRRGDIKLAQLAILLAEVNRMSRLPDGSSSPVVLCGDFNSTPHSPLYRFLTTGHLDYKFLSIGMVSGQEENPGGHRRLQSPLWSESLGISSSCQYQEKNHEGNEDKTKVKNQEKCAQSSKPQEETQQKTEEPASNSPTAVEGAISELTVEDLVSKTTEDILHRWRIEHHLNLQSSYSHKLSPDGRDEITTCHSRTAMTVDYILYTPDSPVGPSSSLLPGGRGLQLLGKLSLVGHSELEQVNGLPNQHHSSDHLPLLARFRLRQ
ncbi:protein angel homolog 2 [Periophthalmus magnuspinnatus]|uniref:protein angel homolog 2 n=1 Tax=Periophthalmus magnuspinnatus TaxID=409849 RepID=UPI0024367449|nr:protein angel homolog 2 [Periophthalmus magnuspinnatus]